eukprot:1503729-Alexandrium_andersonii.AAC.1
MPEAPPAEHLNVPRPVSSELRASPDPPPSEGLSSLVSPSFPCPGTKTDIRGRVAATPLGESQEGVNKRG